MSSSGTPAPAPGGAPNTGNGSGGSTSGNTDMSSLTGNESAGGGRGRGRHRGRGRNRGRGGRGHRGQNRSNPTPTPTVAFEGREEGLKNHIYDLKEPTASAKMFTKTTEELAEWAGRELKMGNYVKRAIEKKSTTGVLIQPTRPLPGADGSVDESALDLYKEELKQFVIKKEHFTLSMQKIYSVAYGQCSDEVKAKLEAMPNHHALAETGDPIGLLLNIQTVMATYGSTTYMPHAIHTAKKTLYKHKQKKDVTVAEYYKDFKSLIEVIEYNGGSFGIEQGLVERILMQNMTMMATAAGQPAPADTSTATADMRMTAQNQAKEATMAVALVMGSDKDRFGKLKEDLENSYTQGTNHYPRTLIDAYRLLTNWKQDPRNHGQPLRRNPDNSAGEVAFTNVGNERDSSDSDSDNDLTAQMSFANLGQRDHSNIQCYNCQQMGHYASTCTNDYVPRSRPEGDVNLFMSAMMEEEEEDHFLFHQKDIRGGLPDSWILLDNQSTLNIFMNPRLLTNIRRMNRYVKVECNGGTTRTNLAGNMKGFPGLIWFHPKGIANILSFSLVEEHYPITYNKEEGFTVHKDDGTTRSFQKSKKGLHYLDTSSVESKETALVSTVADKQSNYTVKDYRKAQMARKTQNMIGRPSLRDYLRIVDNNELPNCPVTRQDILAAEDIFGPNLGSLKGKTVRKTAPTVKTRHVALPPEIHARHELITIGIDIMFVNKVAFLLSISHHIKFGTAEYLPNRQHNTLLAAIKRIRSIYRLGGFNLAFCRADKEFEAMRSDLADLGIEMNTSSDDEHVPEIERYIRTVKERTRATWNTLPFTKLPNRLIVEIVQNSIMWLNAFPANDGISTTLSPRAIITGKRIDYGSHCRIEFGSYVQTHEEHDNSMKTRTIGAIATRPTGNEQGGYYFYSLTTGRRIDRQHWTELPMPEDVIQRIHALARRSKASAGLTFGWRDGTAIHNDDDDDSDSDYDPAEDATIATDDETYDSDYDSDNDQITGVNDDDIGGDIEDNINDDNNHQQDPQEDDEESNDNDLPDDDPDPQQPTVMPTVSEDEHEKDDTQITGVPHENTGVPTGDDDDESDDESDADETKMDKQYGQRRRDGLRPRKPRDYSHMKVKQPENPTMLGPGLQDLEHTALTQYSAKKGLKIFGEDGANAIIKEMKQLDGMDVIEPRKAAMLTREQKKNALEYLMFLKKKRCGRIKGRGCADGRKQRTYKTKEETSSPTVSIEGLFLSSTIDAMEGRCVATCDIPGAFMQADVDEEIIVRLSGPLASLLTRVDTKKYKQFIDHEKGKPVLYVQLKKALYGTLQAALLFWKNLTSELKKWGFELNPYDECVANKMINGKQCTILWHVDDLKISHMEQAVVDGILEQLNAKYGKKAPLTITRGKIHEYLGMTIDYSEDGKAIIRMDEYADGILEEAREDMAGTSTSPAADHLYEVNEKDPILLNTPDGQYFHAMTAKLLFLSKRARPDIQQAVAFLTTRVTAPDQDDYKKLTRVMKYLRGCPHLPLVLEADNTQVIKWWVDASFAVHNDMKSHTGATMSLGKGSQYSTSIRQKLNTKSSTEAELVGVADVMPMILWTRYFLEAQGYKVQENKVYQDNMSAMLLEKNGRASSGKRTRHINIRYFFIADRVKSKEVSIEHCPTDEMLADYLTKPLQGAKFLAFRARILNIQP